MRFLIILLLIPFVLAKANSFCKNSILCLSDEDCKENGFAYCDIQGFVMFGCCKRPFDFPPNYDQGFPPSNTQ
uniref:Beta-defensin n=1 Tax=Panagrolaimus sp. JU765 TaxID=591449 RepID=A0AC34RMC8_9BILA